MDLEKLVFYILSQILSEKRCIVSTSNYDINNHHSTAPTICQELCYMLHVPILITLRAHFAYETRDLQKVRVLAGRGPVLSGFEGMSGSRTGG